MTGTEIFSSQSILATSYYLWELVIYLFPWSGKSWPWQRKLSSAPGWYEVTLLRQATFLTDPDLDERHSKPLLCFSLGDTLCIGALSRHTSSYSSVLRDSPRACVQWGPRFPAPRASQLPEHQPFLTPQGKRVKPGSGWGHKCTYHRLPGVYPSLSGLSQAGFHEIQVN